MSIQYFQYTDSYQKFLNDFDISKKDFFKWGVSSIIFPPVSQVEIEWQLLKERIFNNEIVYIRGYGRDARGTDLYRNLYKFLFNNSNIIKDPTNNTEPHKIIQNLTGLKRNVDILNYQVSHIWGRTKNVFLFASPWNICYTPKIIDPFTGHEASGNLPDEFQEQFFLEVSRRYKVFIEDYNNILVNCNIQTRLEEYFEFLDESVDDKVLKQFKKDALRELSPIDY